MIVDLVTTWDEPCGIAEHSAMLKEAVERADSDITVRPQPTWLNPHAADPAADGAILHLNYHAALHSRWTPEWIADWQRTSGPVVVTYHDTGVPNSDQCRGIVAAADVAVVHEPFDDLPPATTHFWQMGVPTRQSPGLLFNPNWTGWRPVLATFGFPFPWKCYDELAKVTAEHGWTFLCIAPRATSEDVDRWTALNPASKILTGFLPRREVLDWLKGADATAFTYVTHNTGQSAAIYTGIAAERSVIALATCRQMRALHADPIGNQVIHWAQDFEEVGVALRNIPLGPAGGSPNRDAGILALGTNLSWETLGAKYAALYRSLA